ncbi:predicted protein [Nematostella vectensis]|uniref:Oxaloacetate tautomerase FAHD1, mitochondrial n=2 Tax=Nematostella vectensis TaxID=45351 RepID=A7RIB8_NEMVE|nr:predicted protein [Nematostella vectensis]|eukprot:XP_001640847.1 predicted protein [Nematostella vectensis]
MAAKTRDLRRFVDFGRKIVAVGRNYRDHAAELGNVVPDKPLIFLKPTSAYIEQGSKIKIPSNCSQLHHEVELGVVIGQKGANINEEAAMDHVGGYALALDMTDRTLQEELKKKGHPWAISKGFDTSCPVSDFIHSSSIPDPHNLKLWLKVDGVTKQEGVTSDMMFTVPFLISYISKIMTLEEGDLILTGTPAGVSAVKEGDNITAGIEGIVEMAFSVEK